MTRFIAAAAQYPVEALSSWNRYVAKLTGWVAEAARGGARLAVFPEYGAMELAALDPATMGDLAGSVAFVSSLLPRVDALHADLAARHQIHILAASTPWRSPDGRFRNRARLFAPGGAVGVQDKLIMTRFEREEWGIARGDRLTLFDTELGMIGITTCYDGEFPLLARALVEAGADILLVPSCTDTVHGYERVRIGARARALEGQCYAVQAPTVGVADWSPAIDINRGRAGVYGPPDLDFPDDGIVAEGVFDAAQWLFAEIDTTLVARVRTHGAVLNARHWEEQPGATGALDVVVESLR